MSCSQTVKARIPHCVAFAGRRCTKHPAHRDCRGPLMACYAVAPPCPLTASQEQGAQPPCSDNEMHKAFYQEQKDLVECIRNKTKRVRKMAKKVRKAKMEQKAHLQADMQSLLMEVNFDNDRLADLIKRMTDAGYVDDCSSSSSEEEMQTEVLDAAMGGVLKLLKMKKGTVTVCVGKACTRKGKSESIKQALQQRWEGTGVEVQTCSCMGMCKTAANVQVECEGSATTVTALSVQILEEQGVRTAEPAPMV